MSKGQSLRIQFSFELLADFARFYGTDQGLAIYGADPIQSPQIDNDPTPVGVRRALYAAAAAPGRDRQASGVSNLDDLGDLFRRRGAHHDIRLANRTTSGGSGDGIPPLVTRVGLQV